MATMYIEAQSLQTPRTSRRRVQRTSMSLPALILLGGERHAARIHNLSCCGAMIQSTSKVAVDDQLVLTCGTIERLGRVVWASEGCFGVEFYGEIGEDEVLRQLARANAVADRREQRELTRTA